jgi:hypothetical protein
MQPEHIETILIGRISARKKTEYLNFFSHAVELLRMCNWTFVIIKLNFDKIELFNFLQSNFPLVQSKIELSRQCAWTTLSHAYRSRSLNCPVSALELPSQVTELHHWCAWTSWSSASLYFHRLCARTSWSCGLELIELVKLNCLESRTAVEFSKLPR